MTSALVLRTAPDFDDTLMTYQLPPDGRSPFELLSTDNICSPMQQHPSQSAGSPRLQVSSGDKIVLQFNENGHITKPWNNAVGKQGSGQIFVYGTNQSLPSDRFLQIHNTWTADGKGGDQRGRLLYHGPFDDGKCYQYTDPTSGNSPIEAQRAARYPGPGTSDPAQGLNLWCLATVTIPPLEAGSLYTLYWVWDWPSYDPALPQVYTTCMDVDISGYSG